MLNTQSWTPCLWLYPEQQHSLFPVTDQACHVLGQLGINHFEVPEGCDPIYYLLCQKQKSGLPWFSCKWKDKTGWKQGSKMQSKQRWKYFNSGIQNRITVSLQQIRGRWQHLQCLDVPVVAGAHRELYIYRLRSWEIRSGHLLCTYLQWALYSSGFELGNTESFH